MNTIIALRGRANSGKSTTIGLLFGLLGQNGYQPEWRNTAGRDFIAVFTKNGQRIGVTSSGDTYDLVHDRLEELVNDNCSICVCACRTRGGTNEAIIEFTNYSNQFEKKMIDENGTTQATTNMNDAKKILSIIDSMI